MANMTYVEKRVESKSERGIRWFLMVMYFLQTLLTTFPMAQGSSNEGEYAYVTALNMLVQPDGYTTKGDIPLAIMGGILIVFPMTAFFFCLLDKKSKKKWVVSWLCCLVCAVIITFGIGGSLGFGALATLIMNLVCMFMTTQGYQATRLRERTS